MKYLYWYILIALFIALLFIIKKRNVMDVSLGNYFKWSDFDSPKGSGDSDKTYSKNGKEYLVDSGKKQMKSDAINKYVKARLIIEKEWNKANPNNKIVFRVNSALRTKSYNGTLPNAVEDSAHVGGHAFDTSTKGYTKVQVVEMIKSFKKAGFKRFGIYKTFIHVDSDPTKPLATWYGAAADTSIKPNLL